MNEASGSHASAGWNALKPGARQALGELFYRWIPALPPGRFAILMYHAITPKPTRDSAQLSISASLFAAHMSAIASLNVDIVSLDEGVRRLKAGEATRPLVSVVFDDGYVGVHDLAIDILVSHRIPATLFIATDWIGRLATPDAPALGRPLSWFEVSSLAKQSGCTIGSHTHTHPILASAGHDQVKLELRRSRELIAEHVGYLPTEFAYPFGSYGSFNTLTRDALIAEGFSLGCTAVWGRNRPDHDRYALRRMRMSWRDSPRELCKALAGSYDWYRGVQRVQAVRSIRTTPR